jgi:hypothetical protein
MTVEVPAGGQVGIRWGGDGGPDKRQWPHPEGPAIAYLASCNGKCSQFDPSNAQFFKIHEEGLDPSKQPNQDGNDHLPWGQGMWAQNRIQYEDSWNFVTIPNDIKAGEYILRHELISLHDAHGGGKGAQYVSPRSRIGIFRGINVLLQYMACIQLRVTGGGNASPPTTPATQLYTKKNGVVDIYQPYDKHGISSSAYKIPGPPLVSNAKTTFMILLLTLLGVSMLRARSLPELGLPEPMVNPRNDFLIDRSRLATALKYFETLGLDLYCASHFFFPCSRAFSVFLFWYPYVIVLREGSPKPEHLVKSFHLYASL